MSELQYTPKPWSFSHRVEMCLEVHEGCELEDIINNLATTARLLHAFEDYYCEIVLTIAEKLCHDHIEWLRNGNQGWDEYNECVSEEVFKHFTGGARKLTEEEFNQRYGTGP